MTHQCRIILIAKNSKGVLVDGSPDFLRTSSGILNHIISLNRVEFFFSHLAWENIAHVRRHESRVFFVADVDDRVSSIARRTVVCTSSENLQGKIIQERPYSFCANTVQRCISFHRPYDKSWLVQAQRKDAQARRWSAWACDPRLASEGVQPLGPE